MQTNCSLYELHQIIGQLAKPNLISTQLFPNMKWNLKIKSSIERGISDIHMRVYSFLLSQKQIYKIPMGNFNSGF